MRYPCHGPKSVGNLSSKREGLPHLVALLRVEPHNLIKQSLPREARAQHQGIIFIFITLKPRVE